MPMISCSKAEISFSIIYQPQFRPHSSVFQPIFSPQNFTMTTVFTLFSVLLFFVTLSSATCFLPNGTLTSSPGAQPCSFDPSHPLASTCCNSGYDNTPGSDAKLGQPRDECLPNGLCQNRGFSTIPGKEAPPWLHYYRVYCTDREWEGCLRVCDTGVSMLV